MNLLIGAAAGKRRVRLPVDVQRGRRMEAKLLRTLAGGRVPDDGRPVDARRQNVVAALVPLERENRTLVLAERRAEAASCRPDACVAVVAAGGQQRSIALKSTNKHV